MKPSEIGLRRALEVHGHTLRNGLKVLLVDNSSVPTVSLTSSVLAGARYDLESKAGLAIMASRLLDEGTENRTSLEIADAPEGPWSPAALQSNPLFLPTTNSKAFFRLVR